MERYSNLTAEEMKRESDNEIIKGIIITALKNNDIMLNMYENELKKLVETKSFKILSEIKEVMENNNIAEDFYCIEEIIRIFNESNIGISYRHDF